MKLALLLLAFVAAAAEPPATLLDRKGGTVYVRIPPGELAAGKERFEFPHGFWMSRTEVTVAQFERFVSDTGYRTAAEKAGRARTWKDPGFPQTAEHPVVWLSLADAAAYARWADAELPTEAEWQYAARAGSTTKYPWGEELDDRYVWHRENSPDGTHPVGRKLPNAWGLYDTVGNAWEFCTARTPSGRVCEGASALLGGSWTRCPFYKMRDGRLIEAIAYSLGPVRTECPGPSERPDDNSWDDDRGIRLVRRISR